jgi:TolB-like protein/tetratricopeptide (TPR) repeat protein
MDTTPVSEANQAPIHDFSVRRQLEKILCHDLFARSGRMCRFLRFAVEREIEGRGAELKEYLIGVEVFDRKPSYDPRVDPIVRVEARRLRAKLRQYYEGDGARDDLVIEFATGGYAPRFLHRAPAPPSPAPSGEPLTTAVLPFVNLSPGEETEYFSDGLTEELIHALTRLSGLRVVAWTSALQFSDRQHDLHAIREQLHASTVVTGSVRLAGAGLRVRAQLIDTQTGVYLWSETFDRQMQDVFAIQEEIALAIVRTLRVQLSAPMGRGRTTVSSYDWYLKGRYLSNLRLPDDLRRSLACFENAIAADPESALAHAGLADAYSLLMDYGLMAPTEGAVRAAAAAERAIALDPDLAEPYTSLAFLRGLYSWQWAECERLYLRGIALNPGYAPAHHWLAVDCYSFTGRLDEAEAEIEIALKLDPLSMIMQEGRAFLFVLRRRYHEAVLLYRRQLVVDPAFYKGWSSMGRALSLMGKYPEALEALEQARQLAGDLPNILGALGQVHALAGNAAKAREFLAALHSMASLRHVPASTFAVIHMGLGEIAQALDWLEKGCDLRESQLTTLKMHPLWDPLRPDPRFHALLGRLNFTSA